jgi:hypothetical protein
MASQIRHLKETCAGQKVVLERAKSKLANAQEQSRYGVTYYLVDDSPRSRVIFTWLSYTTEASRRLQVIERAYDQLRHENAELRAAGGNATIDRFEEYATRQSPRQQQQPTRPNTVLGKRHFEGDSR